jgi:hypothetical protein
MTVGVSHPSQGTKMRFLLILALLFLSACGVENPFSSLVGEHIETITIGPYTERCQGFIEQDCYLEYNEESGRWEFFYESIQGFDFEPGYIYTLEVRLEDRGTEIQDVGRYAYHLVKVIEKEQAPDDFSYE